MKFTIFTKSSSNKTFLKKYRNTITFRGAPSSQNQSRRKLVLWYRDTRKTSSSLKVNGKKQVTWTWYTNKRVSWNFLEWIKRTFTKFCTQYVKKTNQQLSFLERQAIIICLEKKKKLKDIWKTGDLYLYLMWTVVGNGFV